MEIPLPIQEALRELLGDLLNTSCAVDETADPLALSAAHPGVLATYVDEEDALAAIAVADLGFAAHAGSALVMMPAAVAEEAVQVGRVDSDMLDCYREVANVLSRLLNSPQAPRVRLSRLYRSGDLLPGPVRQLLRACRRRRDFAVTIDSYGEGRLSLCVRGEAAEGAAA